MALLFKPHAGKNKAALDKEGLVEGHFWFTTDDGKSYIDAKNSSGVLSRILLNAGTADSVNVTTLASGTDLNNLTTPGYYGVAASATAQAFTNNPLSGTATGIIIKVYNVDDLIYQEVYGTLGGGMYKRRKSGTSWGGWVQFATTSDNVASATALKNGRTFQVNLASTSPSSAFNGTANITNIGVSGTLPIANGGTGATTAATALTNLGLTATATELNYVDGVTSNIQTQLNGKAPKSHASTATTYGVSTAANYGHAMASSTTPKANGTAKLGSETAKFARGDHVHPLQTTVSGNAGTATKLATARTISLTGDVTGSAVFDGSANTSITATVANDSHSHSNYTPYATKTATTAATAGWYRIATSNADIQHCHAIFKIKGNVANHHTVATIIAGTAYGINASSNISVLQCGQYTKSAISKVRIVYHTTYNNNYAYLEVYNANATATAITVEMIDGTGWTLVNPNTTGSIPSGYSNKEVELIDGTIYSEKFSGSGASLTSLNASNISSGTIAAARLPAATTSAQGAMTAAMVTKLNGIAKGANNYSLPTASSSTLGGVKTTSTVTSTSGLTACPIISGVPYYKNTTYSLSSFGITATAAELNALDGITATVTELNYVDGVTSNIQTQLNNKAHKNYLTSLGTQTAEQNRTAARGGVYTYNTMKAENLGPTAYTSIIGFGNSASGHAEIAVGWTSGTGIWYRALRDCDDNWWDWIKVYDTAHKPTCAELGALPISGGTVSGTLTVSSSLTATQQITGPYICAKNNAWPQFSFKNASNADLGMIYMNTGNGTVGSSMYFRVNQTADTYGQVYINSNGSFYGAVWNDYAEYREADITEPGRVVYELGDDTLSITNKRMIPACSIISDTFGFSIGKTEKCQTPLAQAGRVLAYSFEDRNSYKPGDAVCSGPNGTVSKMSQEEKINHPECIIGYVSCVPTYDTWGENDTKVNDRIWIKVV